jgi:hypothetical protein
VIAGSTRARNQGATAGGIAAGAHSHQIVLPDGMVMNFTVSHSIALQ